MIWQRANRDYGDGGRVDWNVCDMVGRERGGACGSVAGLWMREEGDERKRKATDAKINVVYLNR